LPNLKLPAIVAERGYQGQQTLMSMQTDILGGDIVHEAGMANTGQLDTKSGAGILKKTLTHATKSY
jgi:hypothetical protein